MSNLKKRNFSDILAVFPCCKVPLCLFYCTHIRCVSNWIQLVDSAPKKHIFLKYFLSGWNKWGGGATSPNPISNVCLHLPTEYIDSVELIIRNFPSNFSYSFFFFSSFLFSRFQASPNSSCDIDLWSRMDRDKKV